MLAEQDEQEREQRRRARIETERDMLHLALARTGYTAPPEIAPVLVPERPVRSRFYGPGNNLPRRLLVRPEAS